MVIRCAKQSKFVTKTFQFYFVSVIILFTVQIGLVRNSCQSVCVPLILSGRQGLNEKIKLMIITASNNNYYSFIPSFYIKLAFNVVKLI